MRATVKDLFKKIDRRVFQVERVIVIAALVVMSTVVFFDVVHRTFAGDGNKGVAAFVKLLSYSGTTIEPDSSAYAGLESWFPYVLWAGFIGLGVLGIRTANTRTKMALPKALVFSAVGVVAVYGIIRLYVTMLPNGIIWSQKLALVLTLWVGFVAASMCTYENKHLKVEAAQRAIPAKLKPYVVFASSMFTAVICFSLMWLAARYTVFHYEQYVISEGRGGLVDGLGLPNYQAFSVLPLSFALMSIRFTARGIFALGGELPEAPTIEGIDELEKYQAAAAAAGNPAPSDVPTEVGVSMPDAPKPQSQVQTDPHAKASADEDDASASAEDAESDDDAESEEDAR